MKKFGCKLFLVLSGTLIFLSAGFVSSCGEIEEWKVEPPIPSSPPDPEDPGIETLERELRGAIPFMINYTHEPTGTWAPHKYQYQRANSIDNYAGYWTTTKASFSFGGPLPTLYTYPNDYLGGPIDTQLFTASKDAINWADYYDMPEWRAIAYIIQGYLGHELVDFYGSIPFNDWRAGKTVSPLTYEPGDSIYFQIIRELDEAKAILKERKPSYDQLARIEDYESGKSISNGDWNRWVKFANSIQLRMALNMVKAYPAEAKAIAEAAVADGVLTSADLKNIGYYSGNHTCCLYDLCNAWHNLRLGASLENIMKHFNHPLLYSWFDRNPNPISQRISGETTPAGTDVFGVRAGIKMVNLNTVNREVGYGPFSCLAEEFKYMHQDFIKRSECYFNRAEGALRGWEMGGDAKTLYEEGIRMSFIDNGFTVDNIIAEYIAQENLPAVKYVDPFQEQHNIMGRVTCDVKWNEDDSKELKLEKIITQKYIGNFPMSAESWTTFRRTGYPRLFPPYLNHFDNVDSELMLRRIPLVQNDNNAADMAALSEMIGGSYDDASVRVFWDVPTEERGEMSHDTEELLVIPHNF